VPDYCTAAQRQVIEKVSNSFCVTLESVTEINRSVAVAVTKKIDEQ
jgi:hypothetical protein